MNDCDVIVVGAGLAGLVAARDLAARGHRVRLVDVKLDPGRNVHTTGIFVRRTLEDFALPAECLGPPVRRVVLHSPAGRELELLSSQDEFRVGRMGALYQRLLAEGEAAGVEVSLGTRFHSAAQDARGSAVWLERGHRRWRVRTRFLIGADGAVSRVARQMNLDQNHEWLVGVEDVYEGSLYEGPPTLHCWLDPRLAPGYIAWATDDGETSHVGVGGYAGRFEPLAALATLRSRLQGRSRLLSLQRVERRGGRIPVNGVLRRIGSRRALLIGDAAGAVSPLTAGGLDPCLRLTGAAVMLVSSVLMGAPESLLDAYSGVPFQRHFFRRRMLRRALAATTHPIWAEVACAALSLWPLRELASGLFFGRGSFPDIDVALPIVQPVPATSAAELAPAG